MPKGEGLNAVFTANLWIAGFVDNELRAAASDYSAEFWPGPLEENGQPPTDCLQYDRIWDVRASEIAALDANFLPLTSDIAEWPWELGAPVKDGDGDPSNYNIEGGDRPDITGTQMHWWAMNDRGGTHPLTESTPLGLEIHGSAFVFSNEFHPFLNKCDLLQVQSH